MGILTWFLSPIGSVVAAVVVMLGAWQIDRTLVRQAGARDALVRVEKQTEVINEKARKARDAAGGPGAADRLRQGYCRDC